MKAHTLDDVMKSVQKVAGDYAEVKRIAVFGSFARGEQNEDSDVDLLVSIDGKKSYSRIFELRNDLEESLGRPIDMLTTLSGVPTYFLNEMRKDGLRIYES